MIRWTYFYWKWIIQTMFWNLRILWRTNGNMVEDWDSFLDLGKYRSFSLTIFLETPFWPRIIPVVSIGYRYAHEWVGLARRGRVTCIYVPENLFDGKPLYESVPGRSYLESWKHISVKSESQYDNFHSRKCFWKCRLKMLGHLASASVFNL